MQRYAYSMPRKSLLAGVLAGLSLVGGGAFAVVGQWSFEGVPAPYAQIVYGCLVVLGAVVFGLSLLGLRKRFVEVHPHAIVVPRSELSSTMVTIELAGITGLNQNETGMLFIQHARGTTKIQPWYFESPGHFQAFHDAIARSTPHQR